MLLQKHWQVCCFNESEPEFHGDYSKHSRDVKRCGKSLHTKLSQSNCSDEIPMAQEDRALSAVLVPEARQRIVSTRSDGRSCAPIVRGFVACPPRGCRSSRRSFMCLTILPTLRAMKVSVFGSSSIFSSCLTVWLSRSKAKFQVVVFAWPFSYLLWYGQVSGCDSSVQAE